MKLYYITLNTSEEARQIGRILLNKKLAVCVNWFAITCAYSWQGEITEEPEVVLIVKTRDSYRTEIEQAIRQSISYINFIAELSPTNVNEGFLDWLNAEVPIPSTDMVAISGSSSYPA
jgi:periplasmic divalent cation tolerance protein